MKNQKVKIRIEAFNLKKFRKLFETHTFAVPRFQREFVWNFKRVVKLADSIYKNMPIGSIFIWHADRKQHQELSHQLGVLPPYREDLNKYVFYILDGQQRISVLYHFLNPKEIQNERGQIINFNNVCLSLERNKRIFDFEYRKQGPDNKTYFSLYSILKNKIPKTIPKNKKTVIQKCRRIFLSYKVPIVYVYNKNRDYVREAFIRINSSGMAIRSADEIFTKAEKVGLRDEVKKIISTLDKDFQYFDKFQIQAAIALCLGAKDYTKSSIKKEFENSGKSFKGDRDFRKNIDKIAKSIRKSVDYVIQNYGVMSRRILPSVQIIPVLSIFYYHNKNKEPNKFQSDQIKKWFWATSVLGRYSGIGYSRNIKRDIYYMKSLAKQNKIFKFKEKLDLSEIERTEYYRKSALASAFFCLLFLKHPKHLENGNDIRLESYSDISNRKDKHHIYPQRLLRNHSIPSKKINSIANICFLPSAKNEEMNKKSPSIYLKPYRHKKYFSNVMKSHLIPYESKSPLWLYFSKPNYNKFLSQRTKIISTEFNKIAGCKIIKSK